MAKDGTSGHQVISSTRNGSQKKDTRTDVAEARSREEKLAEENVWLHDMIKELDKRNSELDVPDQRFKSWSQDLDQRRQYSMTRRRNTGVLWLWHKI